MDKVKLIMVTGYNNNKYYNMEQLGNNEFCVTYGRVDKTAVSRTYPMRMWDTKYREKIKKGYRDVTHLARVAEEIADKVDKVGDVKDPRIAKLFQRLQALAAGSIRRNYTISSDDVTTTMVEEAQGIVDELSIVLSENSDLRGSTYDINDMLLDLYHVIPRLMDNVKDYLMEPAGTVPLSRVHRLVDTEQANLDVMAQQVSANARDIPGDVEKGASILERMGLQVAVAESSELAVVRARALDDQKSIGSAYKITNLLTQAQFDKHLENLLKQKVGKDRLTTQLYWHGSRNENWLSILDTGLKIRPSGVIHTGSMFGSGIYFADKFQKAFGYTSVRGSYWASGSARSGYMALFNVHTGKQYDVSRHNHSCYDLSAATLRRKGDYDSVWGKSGYSLYNNEFIVYSPDQCTIAYLVEVN